MKRFIKVFAVLMVLFFAIPAVAPASSPGCFERCIAACAPPTFSCVQACFTQCVTDRPDVPSGHLQSGCPAISQ